MKQKKPIAREFATFRLPVPLKRRVLEVAALERRPLSQMLYILVEEALNNRAMQSTSKAAD